MGEADDDEDDEIASVPTQVRKSKQAAPAAEPQEFLTTEEAAELLRVNIGTLREAIKQDAPPWAKRVGHQIRISRSALLDWFRAETVQPKKRRLL